MFGIEAARLRMTQHIAQVGATATVQRKTAGVWSTVYEDAPVLLEPANRGSVPGIDPFDGGEGGEAHIRLGFAWGSDIRAGDRITLDAPQGTIVGPVIVSEVRSSGLDVFVSAVAILEQTATETYHVTIQRWDEDLGIYVDVFSADAHASTTAPIVGQTTQGASATPRSGSLVFSPAPAEPVGVGDYILGIPWAVGAQVTTVEPVRSNRLELRFRYQSGEGE